MAILCIKLQVEANVASYTLRSLVRIPQPFPLTLENISLQASDDEGRKMGDYRDILSLTRVLMHGPESKADVDTVIERYAILNIP